MTLACPGLVASENYRLSTTHGVKRFLSVPSQQLCPEPTIEVIRQKMLESPPFVSYRANRFHLVEVLPPTQLRSNPKTSQGYLATRLSLATNQTNASCRDTHQFAICSGLSHRDAYLFKADREMKSINRCNAKYYTVLAPLLAP
jgi:hypothetical protein